MTHCPVCGRSYEAGTLYCMDDGTPLAPAGPPPADSPPAGPPSASGELDRLLASTAVPAPAAPPVAMPPVAAPTRSRGLIAVVAGLGVLVVGMLAVVLGQQKQTAEAAEARAAEAETRAADAQRAADAAVADAEEAQQQRAEADARAEALPDADPYGSTTVWANSPGDGFLALRSGPTTASGTRLLKIPHGQPLALGECLPATTSPGGRYGSWCRAVYAGTPGWVFDAFVSR